MPFLSEDKSGTMSRGGASDGVAMEPFSVDCKSPLPPHGPANMLDLFMTRYDYDYNRDPTHREEKGEEIHLQEDALVSGDVRNRPPLLELGNGEPPEEGDPNTIYRQDYTPKSRQVCFCPEEQQGETAFIRDWYRPDFTKDALCPLSEYKDKYDLQGRVPVGKPMLYPGAKAVPYVKDFLHTGEPWEEDTDICYKVTDERSLLPRMGKANDPSVEPSAASALLPSRGPQVHATYPMDPIDYWCTSWTYGDKSLAKPNQLPQAIEGSKRADLLGKVEDKAELVRLLAGRPSKAALRPMHHDDDTNPIFINQGEQCRALITHRVEDEGYVKRTVYEQDFSNPYRLPEIPGNHGEPNPRCTATSALVCPGEMVEGQLTKYAQTMGTLRNSHGFMKPIPCDVEAKLDLSVDRKTLISMRKLEREEEVDVPGDPHRHKLRKNSITK